MKETDIDIETDIRTCDSLDSTQQADLIDLTVTMILCSHFICTSVTLAFGIIHWIPSFEIIDLHNEIHDNSSYTITIIKISPFV